MFASTAPAGAADTEIPSAKKVAKVAVKDNGPEAIAFTFLALDRGYSPRQLVEGVLDHGLEPTGEITEQDGTVVEPVGPPVGVIIDDVDGADSSLPGDDLGGSVSLQTIVDEVPDSRAKAKLMLASIILGAAVGYPLDDLIAEGFLEERFTGLGAITGQRRPKPPDPDFLDDLLVGIGGAKDKPKPGGGEAATSFVGKLVQAGPWGDLYAPAVPAVADSGIDLRIKGERLIGTYSVLLEIPQVGGTCGSTMSFDGKFDLASDEVGYSGVATGTGTVFSNGREGCPGDQTFDAHWNTTVARTSDDRLSGTMDWQAHPGLQFTFEATAG